VFMPPTITPRKRLAHAKHDAYLGKALIQPP